MKVDIRILNINLKNVKNVINGSVVLSTIEDFINSKSSIKGIYGQNGSGKTALISAMKIFKNIASGDSLTNDVFDFININSNYAQIEINFI